MGRRAGLDERKLRELDRYATSDAYDELERLALRYADAMTRTPVEVPDELAAALGERLSPEQRVELTSAIAWENYRARFDHAFGIGAEGFTDGAFCPLPVPADAARRG